MKKRKISKTFSVSRSFKRLITQLYKFEIRSAGPIFLIIGVCTEKKKGFLTLAFSKEEN